MTETVQIFKSKNLQNLDTQTFPEESIARKYIRTIPDRAGDLVMGHIEKAEDLFFFFSSFFAVKICLQPHRAACLVAEFEGDKYC